MKPVWIPVFGCYLTVFMREAMAIEDSIGAMAFALEKGQIYHLVGSANIQARGFFVDCSASVVGGLGTKPWPIFQMTKLICNGYAIP